MLVGGFFPFPKVHHLTRSSPGVRTTWRRLLQGDSGIVSTRHLGPDFVNLPSQVAGLVPLKPDSSTEGDSHDHAGGWRARDHVSSTVCSLLGQPSLFSGDEWKLTLDARNARNYDKRPNSHSMDWLLRQKL